ncbi:hypothetical protein [Helicobacter sp. UBA3407]|uniref:hypothetical protein n=1 Tax=Helicobacter TaxID=209 RepID=UPI002629F0D9|nr:hypothetical protein [Helicobacter sp. UBA3407]
MMFVLVASAFLAGCGESDASSGDASAGKGSKVEFDITAKPNFNNSGRQSNQLVIRSKNDEAVKITDVIVNRGNCLLHLGSGFKSSGGGNEFDQAIGLLAQAMMMGSGTSNKEIYIYIRQGQRGSIL